MKLKSIVTASFIVLATSLYAPVQAQTVDKDKQAAVERYLRAVPMTKMMEDSYAQIAKQLPQEKQEKFISDMRQLVNVSHIESIAKSAMLKTFTLEELSALADFYSSKHGASAMAKFGVYMGEIMPALTQEMQRSLKELQAREQKSKDK